MVIFVAVLTDLPDFKIILYNYIIKMYRYNCLTCLSQKVISAVCLSSLETATPSSALREGSLYTRRDRCCIRLDIYTTGKTISECFRGYVGIIMLNKANRVADYRQLN